MKTGLFGTSESFVSIREASMVDDRLEVPYAKDMVKNAPNVDVDAGGHGIDWDAAWQQAQVGRDGKMGRADGDGAAGAAGMAGGAAMGAAAGKTSGTTTGTGTAPNTSKAAADARARTDGEAMIRSKERMRVTTERQQAGHARLRKYVVTEQQEQTVPVRHEEVRVEREPITGADRQGGKALSKGAEERRSRVR